MVKINITSIVVLSPYAIAIISLLSFLFFSLDIPSFFLLGVHIHPDDTLAELNYMEDMYRDAVKFFGISNAIIMGDMNADCSYLSQTGEASLDISKNSHFQLLTVNRQQKFGSCTSNRFVIQYSKIYFIKIFRNISFIN